MSTGNLNSELIVSNSLIIEIIYELQFFFQFATAFGFFLAASLSLR